LKESQFFLLPFVLDEHPVDIDAQKFKAAEFLSLPDQTRLSVGGANKSIPASNSKQRHGEWPHDRT